MNQYFGAYFMNKKIIYVDFIKKRRVTFLHFIVNKIISLLIIKFNIKNRTSNDSEINNSRRISN